jgi:hypothetical protein
MFKDTRDTSEAPPPTGESDAANEKARAITQSESARKKVKAKVKKAGETPQAGFDYGRLPLETREKLRDLTEKINKGLRRSGKEAFEIGKHFLSARALLPGEYLAWRDAEFPGCRRTAGTLAKIAEVFDGKPELLESMTQSGLGVLAHLDEDIREQIIELIKAKRVVTVQQIKDAARDAAENLRAIDAPSQILTREPVEAPRLPKQKKGIALAQMTADVYGETKTETLRRLLLDVVRPQVEDVVNRIKAVSAVDAEASETEMTVGDLRDQIETTLPTLYRLTGTNPETEAGHMPRLTGLWQEIEQILRALGNALADPETAGAARDAQIREAQSKLKKLLT